MSVLGWEPKIFKGFIPIFDVVMGDEVPPNYNLGFPPQNTLVWWGHTPTQFLGWGLTPSGEVVKGYHPNPTSARGVLSQPKHQIWGPTPTQFHDGGQTSTQTPAQGSDPSTSSTMGSDPNPNSISGVIPHHGVKNECRWRVGATVTRQVSKSCSSLPEHTRLCPQISSCANQ